MKHDPITTFFERITRVLPSDAAIIKELVAMRYDLTVEDLTGQSRLARIARPRQLAYAALRRATNMSLPAIGRTFEGRDHTTVWHGIRQIEARDDPDERAALQEVIAAHSEIKRRLRGEFSSTRGAPVFRSARNG